MKKFSKVAVSLLVTLGASCALTACDDVKSISIEEDDMPRVVFVEGSDLDLSGGFLTVKDKDGTKEIELDSKGIKVSGFDKNEVGEQVLTITYGGKKTKLTITVVEQVTVENAETGYFKGEDFNKSKGRLKITKNDGTSTNVALSSDKVTVSGYDKNTVGEQTVTVTYAAGDAMYTGDFKVTVYEIAETKLTPPADKTYKSHENGIVLDGSYITVKNAAGDVSRRITVTEDMVSGFDLGAATEANKVNPLKQEVTVTYAGKTFKFEVEITYTDVSTFKTEAKKLAEKYSWSAEAVPEKVEQADGEAALAALDLYATFTASELRFVSEEELLAVVRPAAVYGYTAWNATVEEHADAFTINKGTPVIVGNSYESATKALTALNDEENVIYVLADALQNVSAAYGDRTVFLATGSGDTAKIEEVAVEDYLQYVCAPESFETLTSVLNYMADLYEALAEVPAEWTADGLVTYAEDFTAALTLISESAYATTDYRVIYDYVSKWREADDYFEILYTYYYNTSNTEAIAKLQNLHLPGKLETLYSDVRMAMTNLSLINYSTYDTTLFMRYFDKIETLRKEILATEGMEKALYPTLAFSGLLTIGGQPADVSFDMLIDQFLRVTKNGYQANMGAGLENAAFEAVWKQYLTVINKVTEQEDYKDTAEYGTDIEALFNAFVALTPSEQLGFIYSLNPAYGSNIAYAFDYTSKGAYSYFISIIAGYYENAIEVAETDETTVAGAIQDMMLAIEVYARRSLDSKATATFLEKMKNLETALGLMSDGAETAFKAKLGTVYDKYNALTARYADPENPITTDLGDYADEYEAMATAAENLYTSYMLLNYGYATYSMVFTAFADVEYYAGLILNGATGAIKSAFYAEEKALEIKMLNPYTGQATTVNVNWTMDYALWACREVYLEYMTGLSITQNDQKVSLWSLYKESNLDAFMRDASYMIWTATDKLEAEKVYAIMDEFRSLDKADQKLFLVMDSDKSLYQTAIQNFLGKKLTDDGKAILGKLFDAEQMYILYLNDKEGKLSDGTTYLAKFNSLIEEAKKLYGELLTTEKALFDEVMAQAKTYNTTSIYYYYMGIYDTFNPSTGA